MFVSQALCAHPNLWGGVAIPVSIEEFKNKIATLYHCGFYQNVLSKSNSTLDNLDYSIAFQNYSTTQPKLILALDPAMPLTGTGMDNHDAYLKLDT